MKRNLKGNLLLVLAALLWGVSFVMQDKAGEVLSPFAINGIRSYIGTLVLMPFIYMRGKTQGKPFFEKEKVRRRDLLLAGLSCGLFLTVATNFQQFGMNAYPPGAAVSGRSGFITTLYIVLVPMLSLFSGKRPTANVWLAVLLSVVGMFLLCFGGGFSGIYMGDIIVFACAFAFAFQIMSIDRFADRVDGVKLSAVQFLVAGTLSLILMFIFESPTLSDFLAAAPYVLYLGVFSCGIAYTFQIVGQQYSENPTVASIIMSLESVFAALAGAVLVGERLSLREIFGCAIMFVAIIAVELPAREKVKR
ncbi:MAG: DMT family transporter [Oscillospiraceae bacterium]|nr:DMT family transporter [Oscillospiraceae bacterium]